VTRFRSKIDRWFMLTTAVGLTGIAVGLAATLSAAETAPFALAPAAGAGLLLWILLGTRYDVDDTSLRVRCGPFRASVPLGSIRAIRPTRSALSAPALARDRLAIEHDGGALVVSPRDKAAFIQAIQGRVRGIQITDTPGDTRADRFALAAVAVVPVLVVPVVIYVLVTPRAPLDVRLTSTQLVVEGTSVNLADVTSLSLVDRPPSMRRTFGYGSLVELRGRVVNRELGSGYAYLRLNQPPYVQARTRDVFVILNLDTPDRTRAFYAELRRRLPAAALVTDHQGVN
jgi:hypothetical protein